MPYHWQHLFDGRFGICFDLAARLPLKLHSKSAGIGCWCSLRDINGMCSAYATVAA
jgi:kynureninase